MKIDNVKFVRGVIGDDYGGLPSVAFFGRSNVGKSSVINSLVERKNLAQISKIPGKTREANLYLINDSFHLIDFPGYGYARLSIKERNRIIKRIFWYLENEKPEAIFLIVDLKVGLSPLDREFMEVLRKNNQRLFVVANKSDRLKKMARDKQALALKEELGDVVMIPYSAKEEWGRELLLQAIKDSL